MSSSFGVNIESTLCFVDRGVDQSFLDLRQDLRPATRAEMGALITAQLAEVYAPSEVLLSDTTAVAILALSPGPTSPKN